MTPNIYSTDKKLSLIIYSHDIKIINNYIKVPVYCYNNSLQRTIKGKCLIKGDNNNQIIVGKIEKFYLSINSDVTSYLSILPIEGTSKVKTINDIIQKFPINTNLNLYQWNYNLQCWKPIYNLFYQPNHLLNITDRLNHLARCSNSNNYEIDSYVNQLLEAI